MVRENESEFTRLIYEKKAYVAWLAHNQGWRPGRFVCAVAIVGAPPERM